MRKIILALALVLSFSSAAYALEGRYGSGDETVLIAYEATRFKNSLIDIMIEALDDGSRSLYVVNHQKNGLNGLKASDFDAVFISNSGAKAQVRPDVIDWLNDNGGNPPNVVVHTTQTTVWTPAVEVDSITSASYRKKDDTRRLAASLVEEILGKIR